jgi:hypothetical protein
VARRNVGAEGPAEEVRVEREVLAPEDRIAVRLNVDLDLVPDAGIHVVRPRQHQDRRPVLPRAPLEDLARPLAEPIREGPERLEARVHRRRHLGRREPRQRVPQALEELLRHELRLVERHERGDVANALLGEDVALLEEAGLDVLRRRHDAGAGEALGHVTAQERGEVVNHRREEDVKLLALAEDELAVVPGDAFDRVAAVHGAAALPELPALLLGGVGREDQVARIDAEGGEEPVPELMRRPEVQDPGDADPELSARRVRSGRAGRRPCEPSRQR